MMPDRRGSFLEERFGLLQSEFHKEQESIKESLRKKYGLSQILGRSEVIRELHKKIKMISSCEVNVLISGESGTGKELAARAVHYLSRRAGNPFIPVNCGAVPENLFENELFGHVKGAFTDASLPQAGLVKEAEGGTLFLDEIGIISPFIQTKLLRLLQDKEYKPLGNPHPRKANIRIVAATNRDLKTLLIERKFREDLFYRLNIVSLYIPPLRERKEDIPILVRHFIEKYSKQYDKKVIQISDDAMKIFLSYPWPGNIREVENKIQQIIVLSNSSKIDARDVDFLLDNPLLEEKTCEAFNTAKKKVIETFEISYLRKLLAEHKGNVVSAAKNAGKSRTGLWNLLKKYNLSPKSFRF